MKDQGIRTGTGQSGELGQAGEFYGVVFVLASSLLASKSIEVSLLPLGTQIFIQANKLGTKGPLIRWAQVLFPLGCLGSCLVFI